ncbi:MAG: fimbrial protein FimV [Betaproteobacteria bacterium]|nr:fimbrial protein FimV [Betaproteobacteria bacterium]
MATAVVLGLGATNANALSLGRVNVQSALGDPLRAEIEILDINADEASSLVTKVATPDAFKAAGLDYNVVMTNLQTTLQRRPDGRAYIKLSSDRVIQEPFVDLIIEARWNTGRIVRDYTMLFDPSSLRNSTPAITPAQVPLSPLSPLSNQIIVRAGDTAGRIAAAHQPANVSLDQMLVALLRSNPDAFINSNVNRIKAGSLVTLPTQAQAAETPAAQAKQIIMAQSQDFNNFRRNLARSTPTAPVTPNGREVSGKLQANVQDKKPGAATPDKLTLSKGAVSTKNSLDQMAQAQNAKAAASRAAEVTKNIQDLSQIAAASSAVAAASAAKPAPAMAASVASPAVSAAVSAAVEMPAVAAASMPVKPASKAAPIALVPVAEPSFMDNLLEDPLVPAGAAGLIALLAGLGFYKFRQRKHASQDSTFGDSRLQAESFFGNSGGKNVNTSDSGTTGSSMIYSPSQLDAVDDVDPVAEADVYLAYGRDLQAEEILKDALRTRPERLAIHQKLLEIYAKRRDAKAFEAIATLAFNLTNGLGPDWEQICAKGLSLDPDNALYLPGGQPHYDPSAPTRPAGIDTVSPGLSAETPAASPAPMVSDAGNTELDLDLDFSLDEPDLPDGVAESVKPPEAAQAEQPIPAQAYTADASWSEPEPMELMALEAAMNQAGTSSGYVPLPKTEPQFEAPAPTPEPEPEPEPEQAPVGSMAFDKTQVLSIPARVEEPTPASESGMMEFDLGSLSLDFAGTKPGELTKSGTSAEPLQAEYDEESETQSGSFPEVTGDPLETKLALAQEFKAIGDDDGARALIEEVIGEASGDMKAKAQLALSRL